MLVFACCSQIYVLPSSALFCGIWNYISQAPLPTGFWICSANQSNRKKVKCGKMGKPRIFLPLSISIQVSAAPMSPLAPAEEPLPA